MADSGAITGVIDGLLSRAMARIAEDIDAAFDFLLPVPDDARARLLEAMRYATIGAGKRLRPLLLAATGDLYGVDREVSVRAGAAIEAIHAGVPMLATDIPSFREMFAASPWATQNLLMPIDQSEVWSERLQQCFTDPAWRTQAHAAFADIAPQFSFDTMARRYLALLDGDKNS